MSHLLKRTKKTCIKFMRKLSTKQIFLKRLEEEDIPTDTDLSEEAIEHPIKQILNTSPQNGTYHSQSKKETKYSPQSKDVCVDDQGDDEEETNDTAALQSLTSKLFLTANGYEFHRFDQLRSDTASENEQYKSNFFIDTTDDAIKKPLFHDDLNVKVLFEKVKYKEDVRYLRHTPSAASLDNYYFNEDEEYNHIGKNSVLNSDINATENNTNINNYIHNNNNNNNSNAINFNNPIFTNRGLEMHNNYFNSQHHLNHLLPVNVSLGCKTDGNYHQFIIGEERDCFYKWTPVVKWDINGNSLEDDLDNFQYLNKSLNYSPAKSSLRSSSTTLETWLEEE